MDACVADTEGTLWPCTCDLEMTFSVVVNRDLDRARVSTEFYTASGQLCAAGTTEMITLSAGTPSTMRAPHVRLSLQGSSTPPECGLPFNTTRMVSRLYQEGGPAVGHLLTQEFSRAYTFGHR